MSADSWIAGPPPGWVDSYEGEYDTAPSKEAPHLGLQWANEGATIAPARSPDVDHRAHVDPLVATALDLIATLPDSATAEHLIALDAAAAALCGAANERSAREAPARAMQQARDALTAAAVDLSKQAPAAAALAHAINVARFAAGLTSELVLGRLPIAGLDVFAPLPPVPWLNKDLQWAPGRPSQVQGYGGAGKTIAVMAAALALTTERPVWNRLPASIGRKRVIHLDYDQGKRPTMRRYQRLALGIGIDPREVAPMLTLVSRPPMRLSSFDIASGAGRQDAIDEFRRAVAGHHLAIIDALRGVIAGVDENDSRIRDYLDILGDVSEREGCAVTFLHHTGKGQGQQDGRQGRPDVEQGRGSSAIQDGSGSVILMSAHRHFANVVSVKMTRDSADREGERIAPHYLKIVDVEVRGDPHAGLRVEYRTIEEIEGAPANKVDNKRRDLMRSILAAAASAPGATIQEIKGTVGGASQAVVDAIAALQTEALGSALVDRPAVDSRGKALRGKHLHVSEGVDPDAYELPTVAARKGNRGNNAGRSEENAGTFRP